MNRPSPLSAPRPPAPSSPLSGRRVVLAGLVGGAAGLALAVFLQAIVASSTVRLSASALFWTSLLLACAGLGAGMALEAVHQLSLLNPDPAYRRRGSLRQPGPARSVQAGSADPGRRDPGAGAG